MDLRKLIPTDNIEHFLDKFCNSPAALTIHERCFLLRCDETPPPSAGGRRPFVDVEMSLKYVGVKNETQVNYGRISLRYPNLLFFSWGQRGKSSE